MIRKLFALLALVGLAVAPSTTWALGSNHYAQLDLSVIGEKGGLVCATTSSAVPESGFSVTSSSGSIKSGSTSLLAQDITIYAHAQVDEGWEFLGWFDSAEGSGSPTSTDNPYKCVIKASSTSSGSPTTKSLYAKFRDPSVKIPLSEVTFNLSASSLNYTGGEQSVSISEVSYSGSGLTKDVDYTIDPSSILSATGSLLSNETYKVIINAVDGSDYTGSATKEWTIVAPSGEFAADALSTTASGCGLVDGAIKVTDSTELEYVTENKWKANAVIKFPFTFPTTSTTQDDPKVKYIDEAHALIESAVGSVTKDIKNKQYKLINTVLGDHNYIDTITWTVDIPLEDVKAAAAEQKTALEYEISVGALAWTHSEGIKPTIFKLIVPLEGLVLNDENGDQVYPSSHKHLWDIAAVGNVLTASCTNESTDCSIEGRKITLTLAAENQDYTGNAPTVSLAGKDDFDQYLKERITYGTITYVKPAYSQGNDQWYTGDYTAVVTVTVDSVAYELTKAFSITKPEGGYTSGFEVSDISFKTTQEALDYAPDGGTVVCHSEIEGVTLDFKTDQNVTLDLNGKTLTGDNDMTIKNSGSGEVTLTGGTFQQPRKLLNAKQVTIATGKFIFTDLTLENVATQGDNHFTVMVADGAELKVTSGTYEAEFKGKVEISGGRFGLHIGAIIGSGYDLPAPDAKLLAQDRIILTSKEDDTTTYTVVEHTHNAVYGAADNVITVVCDAVNHEFCGFGSPKLTLTAENAVTTGSPYTGAKVETDEGFPIAVKDVTIVYYAKGDQTTPLEGAPSEAGEYVAKVTVEGVTAEKAFQIVHEHVFVFGATDNVLTAACTAAGTCDSRFLAVTLVAENRDWQKATPFEASVTDGFGETIEHTVGEFVYKQNGEALAAAPILTGEYTVEVTVTVDSVDYTLVKAFSITKPEGGYTEGFEASNGLCYDTFAEAFAATGEGETLCYHDPFDNQATFDFTSAKNITIDLCGNTLTYSKTKAAASDLTIVNNGAGIVTLKNGQIFQPKGQKNLIVWYDVYYHVNVSGPFVFDEGMEVESIGTGDDFLVVTASAVEPQPVRLAAVEVLLGAEAVKTLKITGGLYKTKFAGGVEIAGGDFVENPEAFLADGYALGKEKVAGYPFHVFEHTHEFSYSAEGAAITCHCTVPGCYYDGVSTELKAEDVIYDGESHGAWLEPAPGDGFPNVQIGITYKTAEGEIAINGIPSEIGEYIATATVDESVAPGVKVTVRYRITDGRPFDLSAILPQGGEAAGRVVERSTLTVTNGAALKYCTADEAPDGSGIEGWYVGMKVTWPNEAFDLRGFNFTGPKHALFTVNGIKGEGDEKRIFTGEDDIPGISVEEGGFSLFDIDLTKIASFTWWERITVADVKAADKAGAAVIEREVTAWGEKWEEKSGLITYGDTDGVARYTFRIVVDLKDLELSDGTYIYWPEHEHDWAYAVNENSITATCSVAGCPYAVGVGAEFGPKTVASRLANTEPLEAVFRGIETFVGATEATAGEIEYWQGGAKLDAAPIQPGVYTAKSTVTLKDGTTAYEFTTTLTVREGNVVVDGQHYDKPAEVLEASTKDELNIVVWKDFTAEKIYELPASGTKVLDLAGKTVRQPEGEVALLTNLGALTIADSSVTPQETSKGVYRGRLYGDIVNKGVLTITGGYIDGTVINDGGIISIEGGVFRVKPDESWLASGCKIITRGNLYSVERHLHQYALVRSLGGSLVFATCINILVDGKLEVSECDAREVIFLLSPMKGLLAGAISLPTTSLEYNGREQGAELTAINLGELRELIALPTLDDLGEAWDLIQKLIGLVDGEGQSEGGAELLTEILEALTRRGFNPADFILTADRVAALTGIDIGPAVYTLDGQPIEGIPINAGTYKVTRTLTGDIGTAQTIACTYTINPMDINDANPTITCDPESRSVEYDREPHEIVVTAVTLDSPASVKARKLLEAAENLIKNPSLDGALGIFSQLNDMAADLPPAPDFWRDYGLLKIPQYLEDVVKYIPETLVPYLQAQLSKAELVENVDYTVGGVTSATDIGSYVLTVNGMGNYKGTISVEWAIVYDHGGAGHNWKYEANGATLTATCQQDPNCLISPVVAELSADPATKEFDNAPLTASVANAFAFTAFTGLTFGEVYYEDAEGNPLASVPIDVGRYTAKVDLTTASETLTLVLPLEIVYPEGGFKNGFEVVDFGATRGIRYNTLAEALKNASADCTIYARDDISGPTFDFTTDEDVTIDLCGRKIASNASRIISADQTMVFRNDGTGKITFVNGVIEQPRHYILGVQSADQLTLASGVFAFGEGIYLKNVATLPSNYFEITVAPEASLTIADGMYVGLYPFFSLLKIQPSSAAFRTREKLHLQAVNIVAYC